MTGPRLVVRRADRVQAARIRAVAFDFDDTVVRLPIAWQSEMARFFAAAHGLSGEAFDDCVATLGPVVRGWSGTPLTEMARRLVAVARERGLAPLPADAYRAGFDAHWRRVADAAHTPEHVVGGIRPLLRALAAAALPTFLVTGGDHAHKVWLVERLGLAGDFPPDRVYGDEPGAARPFTKRAALHDIATRVGGDVLHGVPSVAFVADGASDMREARAAGALAIGFGCDTAETDVVVDGNALPVPALTALLTRAVEEVAAS